MTQHITFIGAGNMAFSLIGGLIKQGVNAQSITATDLNDEALARAASLGVNTTKDNEQALASAAAVVLAVKPQVMQQVLQQHQATLSQRQPLLISIAAGITIDSLHAWSGVNAIVRCMPNTPALLQLGATGLFANTHCSASQRQVADQILSAVGTNVWLDTEAQIDAVTAVSGSGPAYFFLMIEAMQAAAEAQGLSPDIAKRLSLQTALGAATMASQSSDSPAQLRRNVTSPGGTTEQAILTFEQGKFHQLVADAMLACADHSRTLAANLASDQ